MKKPTVALLRVSTRKQDPARQRAMLDRWAAWREVPLDEIDVRDEGAVSGASADRDVLDGVVDDARRGRIRTLVVSELDRLGRTLARLVATIDALTTAGVKIVVLSSGKELDPHTPEGRLEIGFNAVLAQYERDRTRQRTRTALDGGVGADGVRVSVYGRKLGRPRLRIPEEQLEDARRRAAAGESPETIAPTLTAWMPATDPVTGAATEKPWKVTGSALRRALRRP